MAFKYVCLSLLILLASFIYLIFQNLPVNLYQKYHKNLNKVISQTDEHFDFIIVGAGTAGSVLANRLSVNPNITVLLLEAGDSDHDIKLKIPAAFPQNFGTKNDWAYNSIPQAKKGNHSIFLPRGKVLGGSSSINAMIYMRGSAYDYDDWEKKYNLTGWNYDTMLKYFKKSEKQMRPKDKINSEFHGFDGEWMISDAHQHPISKMLIQAFQEEWNLPYVTDFNGDKYQQEGVGFNQVNIINGTRFSLSDAFLNKDILVRDNLYIRTHSHVTKVLIENGSAIGVEVENEITKEKKKVYCKKEVILSAGAYNTPQILQLSGIGDKKLLDKYGIKVIHDNPEVGENLQDHPTMGMCDKTHEPMTIDKFNNFPHNVYSILEWIFKKDNILTSQVAEINGFVKSNTAKKLNESAPDFQILGAPGIFVDHGRRLFDVPGGFSYGVVLVHPKSRGTVKIQSSDPHVAPLIDPNVFGEDEDFDRMIEILSTLKKYRKNKNLEKINAGGILIDLDKASDEQLKELVHEHTFLLYHGCCTAAMGKVVDERLKVYGVKNLRVVDASVMPEIIRGNTNAPTVAIAERASDLIYEDNKIKN